MSFAGKRLFNTSVFLLLCLTLAGCATKYKQNEFISQLESEDRPFILDVRSKGEFKKGHIPGAVNINVFSLPFRMDEIESPKEDPIIVYCAHGPRAGMARFFLWLGGFKKVYHLEGDWSQWKKDGLPIAMPVINKNEPNEQVPEAISGEGDTTDGLID